MTDALLMDDKEYRQTVHRIFENIASQLDQIDPDVVEAELSQGALTITMGKSKIIVSPQPPVKQIWLAAASLGVAAHFSFDRASNRWLDDKNLGFELYSYLAQMIEQTSGQRPALVQFTP